MLVCDGSEVLLVGTLGCEPGGLGSTPSASLLSVVCVCACPHSVTDARLLAVQQEGVRLALGVHVLVVGVLPRSLLRTSVLHTGWGG